MAVHILQVFPPLDDNNIHTMINTIILNTGFNQLTFFFTIYIICIIPILGGWSENGDTFVVKDVKVTVEIKFCK